MSPVLADPMTLTRSLWRLEDDPQAWHALKRLYDRLMAGRMILLCEACGAAFERGRRGYPGRYCSRRCAMRAFRASHRA